MRPDIIIALLCFFSFGDLLAQQQTSFWFFGEKNALHFTPTGIETLTGSKIQYNEGLSSITDCRGELLFYCDAQTVWNKNNAEMANGTGLLGHYSATQGSIIVQQPGDCGLYYIFTQDAKEHGYADGLRYHIVDMELQNGIGEVVSKNNLLYAPSAEKLTAVRHSDGESVWVISHEMQTNIFRSYLLTSNGLDTIPVLSSVGLPYAILDAMGQMKASPDGRRVGVARLHPQQVEVFDFDATTGQLSNPILLPETVFAKDAVYGLEFSPSSDLLYVANHTVDYLNDVGFLYQFNLLAGNAADIANSAIVVGQNVPATDLRGLQLGPDGKLYVARSLGKHLGVVNQPNQQGLGCDYEDEGVYLGGNVATWSLPSFLVSYFDENAPSGTPHAAFSFEEPCLEAGVSFHAADTGAGVRYAWDFGDGLTASQQSPVHVFPDTGHYAIKLVVSENCCTDTVMKVVHVNFCAANNYYVPTAFSPNDDGLNDLFQVYGNTITTMYLTIYDRWGERLFESTDVNNGWDGKFRGRKMDNGVFAYTLSLGFRNGEAAQVAGSFLLVR